MLSVFFFCALWVTSITVGDKKKKTPKYCQVMNKILYSFTSKHIVLQGPQSRRYILYKIYKVTVQATFTEKMSLSKHQNKPNTGTHSLHNFSTLWRIINPKLWLTKSYAKMLLIWIYWTWNLLKVENGNFDNGVSMQVSTRYNQLVSNILPYFFFFFLHAQISISWCCSQHPQ